MDLITYNFSYSTDEEQDSYFTGENQPIETGLSGENQYLIPGEYRIIEGKLCKINTDLSKAEMKEILKTRI